MRTGLTNLPDLIQPEFRDDVRRQIQEGIARRDTFALMFPLLLKDRSQTNGILIGKGIFEGPLNLIGLEGYILRLHSGTGLFGSNEQEEVSPLIWQELLSRMDETIAYIGPDTAIRYISPAIRHILGFDPKTLNGIPFSDLLLPGDEQKFISACEEAKIKEGGDTVVVNARDAEGNPVRLQLKIFGTIGSEGSFIFTASMFLEETSKHLSNERIIKFLLDSSPAPLIIANKADRTIIAINELFFRLIKKAEYEEILGQDIASLDFMNSEDIINSIESSYPSEQSYHGVKSSIQTPEGKMPVLISTKDIEIEDGTAVILSFIPYPRDEGEVFNLNGDLSQNDPRILYNEFHDDLKMIESIISEKNAQLDPDIQPYFRENISLLQTCSVLYQNISFKSESEVIQVCQYLNRLIPKIIENYSESYPFLSVATACPGDWVVDRQTGLYLGIIIKELLTNCIIHAFYPGESGRIEISFNQEEGWYILQITDSGKGFPDEIILSQPQTSGMKLVETLASRLSGTVTFSNESGARARVILPHPDL